MNGLEAVLDLVVNVALQVLAAFGKILFSLCDTEVGKQLGLSGGGYPGAPTTPTTVTAESLKAAGVGTVLKFVIPVLVGYLLFKRGVRPRKATK